jgi:hypothetical protein
MKSTATRLTLIAVLAATLTAGKTALAFIPNVEIVTLLLILFGVVFGWRISLPAALIFCTLEIFIWGFFPVYVLLYFIYWPLLTWLADVFGRRSGLGARGSGSVGNANPGIPSLQTEQSNPKGSPLRRGGSEADGVAEKNDNIRFAIFALSMTLFFGFFSGLLEVLFLYSFNDWAGFGQAYLAIYLRGIPFYAVHIGSNLIVVALLFSPLKKVLERVKIRVGVAAEERKPVSAFKAFETVYVTVLIIIEIVLIGYLISLLAGYLMSLMF